MRVRAAYEPAQFARRTCKWQGTGSILMRPPSKALLQASERGYLSVPKRHQGTQVATWRSFSKKRSRPCITVERLQNRRVNILVDVSTVGEGTRIPHALLSVLYSIVAEHGIGWQWGEPDSSGISTIAALPGGATSLHIAPQWAAVVGLPNRAAGDAAERIKAVADAHEHRAAQIRRILEQREKS